LSTLTKVLIVLLTISSIFLCGIVVTYVANAENFRKKYNNLRVEKDAAVENERNAKKQLNELTNQTNQEKLKLNNEIAALKERLGKLNTSLVEAQRQQTALIAEAGKWKAITREFYDTNEKQRQLLEDTLAKLKSVQAQQIVGDRELKETTASLIEKMKIIDTLERTSKQLLEEKTYLQNRLDTLLQQTGKVVAPPEPLTPIRETARVAPPTVDIGLKGLVNAVDLEKSLAEISVGKANGVKEGMRFHVTRGDKFICDIVILDIEPEKAVGSLELMDITQEQPKTGDMVSTNL
jgi:hypothetical protein